MRQRLKEVTLLTRQMGVTPYGERKEVWIADEMPLEAAIYYQVGGVTSTANEVETTAYSVVGLTDDPRPKEQDKIQLDGKTYLIDHIIPTHRMKQLFLKEDRQL